MLRLVTAPTPLPEPSDDELMALVGRGEPEAFERIVVRYEARIRRYLSRMVGGAEAGDLTQEVFCELWRRRAGYRAQGHLAAYLYRIAHNRAVSHLRWRRVRALLRSDQDPELVVDKGPGGFETLLRRERERRLSAWLLEMPLALREVVVLHHVEQLPHAEVASVLGIREGTARVRAHRALAWLRERSAAQEEGTR